jgi:hypothetical protein
MSLPRSAKAARTWDEIRSVVAGFHALLTPRSRAGW